MTQSEAYTRATTLCTRSEYCPFDIMHKCRDWGLSGAEAESVVKQLKEERFIDDERYVHAFVNDKYKYAHWGRVKIAFALRQKQLPDALINNTLDDVIGPEDYLEALVALLRQKMRGMDRPLSQADRAKVYRFAASRGYEANFVSQALRVVDAGDIDD